MERRGRRRRGIERESERERERERERHWQGERAGFLGRESERGEYGGREDILGGRVRGMSRRRRRGSGSGRSCFRGSMLDPDADLRRWTLERMHRDRLRSRVMRDEELVFG